MRALFRRIRRQNGAALVEYALIASLIALPSVAAMEAISDNMNDEFDAIETNSSGSESGATTTTAAGATTTTAAGGTTTTAAATTTTAAPTTTTTAGPTPPAFQTETVNTSSGSWTFGAINGSITLDSYSKNRGWTLNSHYNSDGDLILTLDRRRGGGSETITAWLDDDGFLHVSVS